MRSIPLLAELGLILLLSSACSEATPPQAPPDAPVMFRGDARHTGVFHTRGPDPRAGLRWRFETDGPVRSSPVVSGDLLYAGSTDGRLYALDAATGEALWSFDAESPVSSSPAVARGLVLFASADGVVRAVDARQGELRWRFDTGDLLPWPWGGEGWDVYWSSPVVAGETVVFGAGDGSVYALDLDTGAERWRFSTPMRIRSTPAVTDRAVWVGGGDGVVYRLALEDGALQWTFETDGADMSSADFGFDRKTIVASPAVEAGLVLVGSRDGYMYALSEETGDEVWRISHEVSWAMSSPAVTDEALFSGTSDGLFVHRVDLGSGAEVWRRVVGGYTWSSPALAGGTLYIGDGSGVLHALDAESGADRWSFQADGGVYSSPWVDEGVVYFGADDGAVYALDEVSPMSHRVVYWDSQPAVIGAEDAERVRSFFELRGYRTVDGEGLARFLTERVNDGASSVVVFALPHIPEWVAAEPSDTVLFRRYLDAGGKVVWSGPPPMALVYGDDGRLIAYDTDRTAPLLDVDATGANFDFYGSQPTALGRTWGLDRGWVSTFAIGAAGVEPLALDEHGQAGAWVRSYGGPAGSGFVGIGVHEVTLEALEGVLSVAEYGLAPRR